MIHALSGCDTTSALYGLGKVSVFKKIMKSKDSPPLTDIITATDASLEDITRAGQQLLTMLYGGKPESTLNNLRYLKYIDQVSMSTTRPIPERLPPTERAAYFHVLRVHLQVVQWKTLMVTDINPQAWMEVDR